MTALLRLLRWPGALTASANAATGFLLAHDGRSPGGWGAACAAVASGALVYSGGVVLNDAVDAERDVAEHPNRPIPQGLVARSAALRFAGALLAAGVGVAWLGGGGAAGAAAAFAAAAAVLYDGPARATRFTGALALCVARGANSLTGAAAAAGALSMPWDRFTLPHGHALILAAYTALLTFASTLEGRALRAWTTGGTAVALSVVAGASVPLLPRISWAEAPLVPLALLLGSLVAASRTRSDASGPGGCAMGPVIRAGVFGFLLVDAVWLFGTGRFDAGFWLVLVYVAMRLLLLRARS